MNRRSLLTGIGALLAAPAIVRADSLMAIKPWKDEMRFKCYEHIGTHGRYGAIRMQMTTDFGDKVVLHVGASEPILTGDYVVIRDGYARPLTILDMIPCDHGKHGLGRTTEGVERMGVAITNSDIPRTQTHWV